MNATFDADVLVVGGGLSGLSSAAFLARLGVRVVLAERHAGTLLHPRARTINPRTAELMRLLGIEDQLRHARGYLKELPAVTMLRVSTLAGEELSSTTRTPPKDSAGSTEVSPSRWGTIDQDELEVLLRHRAEELGALVRFRTTMTGFAQDDTGVTATFGSGATLRVRYLIAADGRRGTIRSTLGIGEQGPGTLGHVLSMVFDADLSGPLRGRHDPDRDVFMASCHCAEPAEGTVLFPYGTGDRWVLHTPYDPADDDESGYPDERCAELVRAAVGVPDLPLTLVPQLADGTKVLGYEIAAAVAEKFRVGRIFLVGDAAHVMPPAGAFGAGTGIQDAHNLAWKLAAVLAGHCGPELLDSYEQERRPVARFTTDQALLQMRDRSGQAVTVTTAPVEYDAVVFGYRYSPGEPRALPPRELTGLSGTRAPHLMVREASTGKEISMLDLYGDRHVLLAGPDAADWAEAARSAAEGLRVPLDAYRVGADLLTDPARWCTAHGLSATGVLVVRPDGFVAWRGESTSEEPASVLTRLLYRKTLEKPHANEAEI